MREVRFRGKRVDNNEWVYGYYVCHKIHGRHGIWTGGDGGDWYKVIPETVGQFTGLKDIKDNTICEGDLLEDRFCHVGVVEFDVDRFCWEHGEEWGEITPKYDNIEIIGNIHDNPELMNEKKS